MEHSRGIDRNLMTGRRRPGRRIAQRFRTNFEKSGRVFEARGLGGPAASRLALASGLWRTAASRDVVQAATGFRPILPILPLCFACGGRVDTADGVAPVVPTESALHGAWRHDYVTAGAIPRAPRAVAFRAGRKARRGHAFDDELHRAGGRQPLRGSFRGDGRRRRPLRVGRLGPHGGDQQPHARGGGRGLGAQSREAPNDLLGPKQ